MRKYDFLVIGAGIIGTTIALEIKRQKPKATILVLEKEAVPGYHSSGRNSGVLHAGFYYSADSLKAQLTANGCIQMKDYCRTRGIRLNECGKLVIARNDQDLNGFQTLLSRAKSNSVVLHEITEQDAQNLEPLVTTYKKALWSPETASVDPIEVLLDLQAQATKVGIEIRFSQAFLKRIENNLVETPTEKIETGYVVNAAGLYADEVAKQFGFSKTYRILPFKGLYLYNTSQSFPLKKHIYPVPNLSNPFLGVHHTITMDGKSKIGPTAIPAFWREQYEGFSRFRMREFMQIFTDEISLALNSGFDFRHLAVEEIKKYSRSTLVREASFMAKGVRLQDYTKWGRAGIRAQLFNTTNKTLEMDFKIESDSNSAHILNAVSPAFTASLAFAKYFCWLIGI